MELGNYKCSGKKYNGEKAIISLTSWKARINTVSKTLYSLLRNCPGFHIVLVLSEEEFPKMEKELPENLMLFVDNELIELLWIYPNIKSFKKVLPTMDKYKDVPIVSADDDCIYTYNYVDKLYNVWNLNKNCVVTNCKNKVLNSIELPNGCMTLYCPGSLSDVSNILDDNILKTNNDDVFIGYILYIKKIKLLYIKNKWPIFHDEIRAMSKNNMYESADKSMPVIQKLLKDKKI